LRAVVLAAAYEACRGEGGAERVGKAGVALELLQTYLLIHDDWMDQDEVRRGGPSVHAALRKSLGDTRLGDASAILAGDYGAGLALGALLAVDAPPARLLEAARAFARIQEHVVRGQLLDLLDSSEDVEVKHDLKTGSYTVRGPLAMGAALAGASDEQKEALERFGRPLGIAFQLRDDLLGVFGDPSATGKPTGSDLREGKRTALVVAVRGDRDAERLLPRVLGVSDAPDEEVQALIARIVASGAKAKVEARIDALVGEAREVVARAPFAADARVVLLGLAKALGDREK
jgi:geranylgeranyl diphosphate synthase type I